MTRGLVATLLLCCSATLGAQPAEKVLRVGIVPPHDEELRRGLAFGIDEARRSMALFGWRLDIDTVGTAGPDTARLAAVVSDAPLDGIGGIPLLLLSCDPSRGAFVVAACPAGVGVEWHPSLERYGAGQVNDRYRAATGRGMTAAAWRAWFSMKVLSETALRARDPSRIAERLRDPATRFDGHKGTALRFDSTGALVQPVYDVARDPGGLETARERRP